ncbi:hypothetical protein WN51_03553 [Melipona quadrifasciata]|uniref:Uncharacterized protein n=1 Tax=Melipona quadrifasciata TaxID=166423 RepID=A0A0N0BDW6_9HYME|nr:hypothetical protein WN51_03553 [Melipona quadrifasciata]
MDIRYHIQYTIQYHTIQYNSVHLSVRRYPHQFLDLGLSPLYATSPCASAAECDYNSRKYGGAPTLFTVLDSFRIRHSLSTLIDFAARYSVQRLWLRICSEIKKRQANCHLLSHKFNELQALFATVFAEHERDKRHAIVGLIIGDGVKQWGLKGTVGAAETLLRQPCQNLAKNLSKLTEFVRQWGDPCSGGGSASDQKSRGKGAS